MAKRYVYVDIETSGLEPMQGAVILGIGAIAEVAGKTRDRAVEEFSVFVKPTKDQWAVANPGALAVNGLTWEFLQENGLPFDEARDEFLRFLVANNVSDRLFIHVGQNPAFDLKFMGHFMGTELEFIGYPGNDPYDVRDFYSILVNHKVVPFARKRSGKNISLALGVEPEPDVHDALEGARVVRRNFQKCLELMEQHNIRN